MKKTKFKTPKNVLVFNGSQVLIAIAHSLQSTSMLSGNSAQAISLSCTGKYISSKGFYFRHVHPDIEIEWSDLGKLKLNEYDELCGKKRRYHTVEEMKKKRIMKNNKEDGTNKQDNSI